MARHNSDHEAKIKIRRRIFDAVGGPVLETHGGYGMMRRECWPDEDTLAIDSDKETPDCVHADSLHVLRAIDLGKYRYFDVDAFGSPWRHLWLITQRRKLAAGETIGLAITSGTETGICHMSKTPKQAGWSAQMMRALRIGPKGSIQDFKGKNEGAQKIAAYLVASWWPNVDIKLALWAATATVQYHGLVVRGC